MDTQESFHIRLKDLLANSEYKSKFDWDNYLNFFKTHKVSPSLDTGINLINNFIGCKNCHVGFQIDTYLEGCTHDCKYCYAKLEGEAVGKWNSPIPLPLDLSLVWEIFYRIFEKGEKHPFSGILKKRVPLRVGSLSDPFLSMENKLGISEELIKLLNHYDYPYLFFTRSHLVADERFTSLMDPRLGAIQISIPSLDEKRTRILEPRASSPAQRLDAIKTLREKGFWVTARINPLFPTMPDESLTSGKEMSFDFDFYTDELVKKIAETGCKSVLSGFVTLKSTLVDTLGEELGFPLRSLMKDQTPNKDFFFSQAEISAYFSHIQKIVKQNGMDFSTCYLGQPEEQYFANQNLWDNKKDCCNNIGNVEEHKITTTEISREDFLTIDKNQGFLNKLVLKMMAFLIRKIKE